MTNERGSGKADPAPAALAHGPVPPPVAPMKAVPEAAAPLEPRSSAEPVARSLHAMLFGEEAEGLALAPVSSPDVAADLTKSAAIKASVWPAWIPSAARTLGILAGVEAAPETIREFAASETAKLSPVELALIKSSAADAPTQALRDVIAIRWRLAAAVALEQRPPSPVDVASVERLLSESDIALTAISQLAASVPGELAASLDQSRSAIARDAVHLAELLHQASQTSALEAAASSAKKYDRLTARMVSMSSAGRPQKIARRQLATWVTFAVITLVTATFHTVRYMRATTPPPALTISGAPAGMVSAPSHKYQLLIPLDGKPKPFNELVSFKQQTEATGAKMHELAPGLGEYAIIPAGQPDPFATVGEPPRAAP